MSQLGHGQGKVKAWMADRGFGFITDEEGEDVFVHAKSLPPHLKALEPGQRVQFEVKHTARGIQAVSVVALPGEEDGGPPDAIPESQFLGEIKGMLPNLREAYLQKILEWGRRHGWVSD